MNHFVNKKLSKGPLKIVFRINFGGAKTRCTTHFQDMMEFDGPAIIDYGDRLRKSDRKHLQRGFRTKENKLKFSEEGGWCPAGGKRCMRMLWPGCWWTVTMGTNLALMRGEICLSGEYGLLLNK